jgi:hypothetical protein
MSDTPPSVAYWHLYADAEGVTHQRRCAFTDFRLQGIRPGTAPQWLGGSHHDGASVLVTVLPAGWVGTWHENPRPQWIVPLSGRWFVESMDGARVEMGPGELSFGEDQGSVERDGKRGHLSGTAGDAPAVLMLVQFDTPRAETGACPFE